MWKSKEALKGESMRIKNIAIKNYRGLAEWRCEIAAPDDCLVLFGPNGCGKTSVLEAVLIALGRYELLDRPLPMNQDYAVELEILCDDGHLYQKVVSPSQSESKCLDYGKDGKCGGTKQVIAFDGVLYLPSWRFPVFVGDVGVDSGDSSDDSGDYDRDFMYGNSFTNLAAVKQRLVNFRAASAFDEKVKQKADDIFSRINTAWKLFQPSADGRFDAALAERAKNHNPTFDVYLLNKLKNERLSVDNLSSGEIDVFTLLANILLGDPEYKLILIDEPELHLHQQWRRMFIPAIRQVAPKAQIIAASHSEEIWNSVFDSQKCLMK